MSKHIHILVGTTQSFDVFVSDLEKSLQIVFKREIDAATNQLLYEFEDDQSWIDVYENNYENDINVPFDLFNHVVSIRAKYRDNWEKTFMIRDALAIKFLRNCRL